VVEPFFKITRDETGTVVNVEELVAPTPTRRRSTKRIRRADEEPEDGA
jgi:DNA mismatch repair ATPase MutL